MLAKRLGLRMLGKLKQVARIAKRIAIRLTGFLLTMIYAPRQVLKQEGSGNRCDIRRVRIDNCEYSLARIREGRLFTNRDSNISIIDGKKLVPTVSWQYLDGRVLADANNFRIRSEPRTC